MKISVHMMAFSDGRGVVRQVEVPTGEAESARMVEDLLGLVFRYGQNDFQPMPFPSVSVGDVIQVGTRYFMVMPVGFRELTRVEFDGLVPPTALGAYAGA